MDRIFYCKNEKITLTEKQYSRFGLLSNLVEISEENEEIDVVNCKHFNVIKFISDDPNKYFLLSKSEMKHLDFLIYENPLNYDEEYFDIYEKEKSYRNLNNYDHLTNITKRKFVSSFLPCSIKSKNNLEFLGYNYFTNKKFEVLFEFLLKFFGEFKDNILIAGGFALSYYLRNEDFKDIDLFIHSCNEEKALEIIGTILDFFEKNKKIVVINTEIKPNFVFNSNEHVICLPIIVKSLNLYDNNKTFEIKIQIIKRLYKSPSEIIHGFDIDSSCILLNFDSQIYATNRFIYAFKNSCNTVNFERLSPSYEHRLGKYFNRGFDISIPQFKYFKYNAVGNSHVLEGTGSDIVLKYLMSNKFTSKISDYSMFKMNGILTGEFKVRNILSETKLKKINPNEQSINTFHRIFLDNPMAWYPRNIDDLNVVDFKPPLELLNEDKNIVLGKDFQENPIFGKKLICRKNSMKNIKKLKLNSEDIKLFDLNNKFVIVGNEPRRLLMDYGFNENVISICKMEDISYHNIIINFMDSLKHIISKYIPEYVLNKYDETLNQSYKFYIIPYIDNRLYWDFRDKYRNEYNSILEDYYSDDIEDEEKIEFINNEIALIKRIYNLNMKYIKNLKNINDECIEINFKLNIKMIGDFNIENIHYHFPKLRIFSKIFDSYKEILNTQHLDYNRIIYDGKKFYTDKLGEFAIKNKVHFSSNYEYACSKEKEQILRSTFDKYNPISRYENYGYSYYDPDLLKDAIKTRSKM